VKRIHATQQDVEELRLQAGDVLFNEGGDRDKLGRGWVWNGEIENCIHQNHVFRARLTSGVNPKFLSIYANSHGQDYFNREGKQTTNLASINLTKLGRLPVPLPPSGEQDRIVAEVERLLSDSDAVANALIVALVKTERLRATTLAAAFSGRLVPQDPHDEPASVMLERIRTEQPTPLAKSHQRKRSVAVI
jgi:type I restriction enzyme, S subunit